MQVRNYSNKTITSYLASLNALESYQNLPSDEISSYQVKDYLQHLIQTRKVSVSCINQVISAVKILQCDVLGNNWESIRIKRPRRIKMIPVVLSKQEVQSLINGTRNLKHRAILAVIYSGGLRISELISLKPSDIDSARKHIITCKVFSYCFYHT